jgi:hypothetical protein
VDCHRDPSLKDIHVRLSPSSSIDSDDEKLPLTEEVTEVDGYQKAEDADLGTRWLQLRYCQSSESDVVLRPKQTEDDPKFRHRGDSLESGYLSICIEPWTYYLND